MEFIITDLSEELATKIYDSLDVETRDNVIKRIERREVRIGYEEYLYDITLTGDIVLASYRNIDGIETISIRATVYNNVKVIAILDSRDFREIKII